VTDRPPAGANWGKTRHCSFFMPYKITKAESPLDKRTRRKGPDGLSPDANLNDE